MAQADDSRVVGDLSSFGIIIVEVIISCRRRRRRRRHVSFRVGRFLPSYVSVSTVASVVAVVVRPLVVPSSSSSSLSW
jgi:hypothetical protein